MTDCKMNAGTLEAALQKAFELGGLEDGSYHLEAEEIEQVIRAAAPAVQGEPVAVLYADGTVLTKAECGDSFAVCCKVQTPLYAAPQPAEQRCEYCDGTGDVHSLDGEWRGTCSCPAGQQPGPDVAALVEALEIIEKGEDTGPDGWGAFRWADCRNIARAALAAYRNGAQP